MHYTQSAQFESDLTEQQWQSSLNKEDVLRCLAIHRSGFPASTAKEAIEFRRLSGSSRQIALAQLHDQLFSPHQVFRLLPVDVLLFVVNKNQEITNELVKQIATASIFGINHIALLMKQDSWSSEYQINYSYFCKLLHQSTHSLHDRHIQVIPVSLDEEKRIKPACGDLAWYDGFDLYKFLHNIPLTPRPQQTIIIGKPGSSNIENSSSEIHGTILSGRIDHGSSLRLASSGEIAAVAEMNVPEDVSIKEAASGDTIVLHLDRAVRAKEIEILSLAKEPVAMSDQFQALLFWQGLQAGLAGRSYMLDIAGQQTRMTITALKKTINPYDLAVEPCQSLQQGHIGVCNLSTNKLVAITPYHTNPALGKIAIYSLDTNDLLAFGLIRHSLRRGDNIHRQSFTVARHNRECLNNHSGKVIWFTGLSGSGKSALANALEQSFHAQGIHTYLLDGDNIRHGLNNDLGFTEADRVENIRRIAEVAKLMLDAGLVVMTAFISPFRRDREMARQLIGADNFVEVYVSTPLDECERRDPKGLYKKARTGQLPNMTGIDSPYEAPLDAAISIDTSTCPCDEGVNRLLNILSGQIALKIQ